MDAVKDGMIRCLMSNKYFCHLGHAVEPMRMLAAGWNMTFLCDSAALHWLLLQIDFCVMHAPSGCVSCSIKVLADV
jgi:hypothetical protein